MDNLSILKNTILSQINSLHYMGTNITRTHNICVCQAFLNLIDRQPEEMVAYMTTSKHHNGFQHKIFQEYIFLLENKLPFSFKKNDEIFKVNSLLDENLNLFYGISTFESTVSEQGDVKNETKEFYIGGRKATYCKPYYIGKLLDIIDIDKSNSIMNNVKEYSFSKIKLNNIVSQTKVRVSHLRVPPHYQMGGMVYVNRMRQQIVNQMYFTINGYKRESKHYVIIVKD